MNRVKQVKNEIDNKNIIEINDGEEIEFIEHCLDRLHHDRDLAALHIRKLLAGAEYFLELYRLIPNDQTGLDEAVTQEMTIQRYRQQNRSETESYRKKKKKSLPFI